MESNLENINGGKKLYKIGAIAKATGLSVHNLRIWEKRYSAIEIERTDSGRRLYSEDDLKRLTLLKQCVDIGMAISTIAACENPELEQLLAELGEPQTKTSAKKPGISIVVVGSDGRHLIQPTLNTIGSRFQVEYYESTEDLLENEDERTIDLLILDMPSLTQGEARLIGRQVKALQVRKAIICYRYARQQDIAYLKTVGIHPLKAPFDPQYLHSLILQSLEVKKPNTSLLPVHAPSRLFNDKQLNTAANLTSSIECECPQHMAEIIKGLTAFEAYSARCENMDKASQDLHHHIYLKTAEARAIMETLMHSVLEQEGINLDKL